MVIARVEGSVVATRKHPSFAGWRLLLCQPLGAGGEPEGTPVVAIDPHGAALHSRVLVCNLGAAAREVIGDETSPVRLMIVGILDPAGQGGTH
ncbi:MAG TPA: EutN/CcmL family microcompartment protein [Anaeromyxobacteraceae bacterium]|nr:EutN/CcmL family microcompartment protein [Anaeromyxobacteraceae bacterium]